MNYSHYFIKYIIKFTIQVALLLVGFKVSILLWERQFEDTKKISERKDAILVVQETIKSSFEREARSRRLIGFFSARWDHLNKKVNEADDQEYSQIVLKYRDCIIDWNVNKSCISSKLQMTFGVGIARQFDTLNVHLVNLNKYFIEPHLLKASVNTVLNDVTEKDLVRGLSALKEIDKQIESMDSCMSNLVDKGLVYKKSDL